MTRIAFVAPLPPAPTGVADYAAEIVALLCERSDLAIDVFHAGAAIDRSALPARVGVFDASSLTMRHAEQRYDLALYQMGNDPAHAFQYDLISRLPGLLVLHDLVLHHSRARMFLDSDAARDYAREPWSAARRLAAWAEIERYVAELEYAYPGRGERLAAVHLETSGRLLPYAYPLFRIPVEASRLTVVHNDAMAEGVRAEVPEAIVAVVPHHAREVAVAPEAVVELRRHLGFAHDDIVVGTFGLLSEEKQVETVARAIARVAPHLDRVRLLLVGTSPTPEVLRSLLESLGIARRSIVTGRVPWPDLPVYMTLPDLVVQLRYPTAGETSGALLRLLAQGRPAIVSDISNQAQLPDAAVIRADLVDEEGDVTRGILRLAADRRLRDRMSAAARAFVAQQHRPQDTLDGYRDAIDKAMRLPDPRPRPWPAHWPRAQSVGA